MRRLLALAVLVGVAGGCGTPADSSGGPNSPEAVPMTPASSVPSLPSATEPPVDDAVVEDLVVQGTRTPYTFEETQAFGEFGPLLWGLVTTLNGTDQISHGPGYEWVIWGPLWAGHQPDPGPHDVYGVTDMAAVDLEAIAAIVPVGETVVLREVEWSLDELEMFSERLRSEAPGNGVCSTGSGGVPNRLRVVATGSLDLGDVPPGHRVLAPHRRRRGLPSGLRISGP